MKQLSTLIAVYYSLSLTSNAFTHNVVPRITSSKALVPKYIEKVKTKCKAKSFNSMENDRPPIPFKSRNEEKKENNANEGDVWSIVKSGIFSAYDQLSTETTAPETEQQQQQNKAPSTTPGGQLMRQYKTTLEEKEESSVTAVPPTRSRWETFKNGVYDSLELEVTTTTLDRDLGSMDPSNMKPFFPGGPPTSPNKKENPLERTISTIFSTAEAIKNIPSQVVRSSLSTKASIESTVETVQALPEKFQKSYEDTVDTAIATVETIQALPGKIETSYKETVDTATAAVETVQSIPTEIQKSYEQTVDTATAVVDNVKSISNTVSTSAQNVQKSLFSTKKNIEELNAKVQTIFSKKEKEQKREVKNPEQYRKATRISKRVVALPRDEESIKEKKEKDIKSSLETKKEVKKKQVLFTKVDDIDPSLGKEVDLALKLAEEALAIQEQNEGKEDSLKKEESTKNKKKSFPLFHLLLDMDD